MIRIHADPEALARAAADAFVAAARESASARGVFRVGLSGGTTPRRLYALLAGPDYRGRWDAGRAQLRFADERAVPPEDSASNYALVRATLIDPLGMPATNVQRMRAEHPDIEAAALEYETHVRDPLDLLILGIGADGHTASLFPGLDAVYERERLVVAVDRSPKPPARRLTITPRVIDAAHTVIVLASGLDKAEAVALAQQASTPVDRVPARCVRERDWYLDRDAASGIAKGASPG